MLGDTAQEDTWKTNIAVREEGAGYAPDRESELRIRAELEEKEALEKKEKEEEKKRKRAARKACS